MPFAPPDDMGRNIDLIGASLTDKLALCDWLANPLSVGVRIADT